MNTISVIIPAYNASGWILEALGSISRQSLQPMEVIVIDDGSTDGTRDIVDRHCAGIVSGYDQHRGVAAALNQGLDRATGTHIAFLDADDMWAPTKLELQANLFNERPQLDMVFACMQSFLCPSLSEAQKAKLDFSPEPAPAYVRGTSLIKRSVFDQVGYFDTGLRVGEFVDWYLRAQDMGFTAEMSPQIVLYRRWHAANMTLKAGQERTDYIKLFNSWRRRQQEG